MKLSDAMEAGRKKIPENCVGRYFNTDVREEATAACAFGCALVGAGYLFGGVSEIWGCVSQAPIKNLPFADSRALFNQIAFASDANIPTRKIVAALREVGL